MRILIVEDEIKAAEYLRKGFTENGFVADVANDGESGREKGIHLMSW
jgi:two-component system copper resistance phosphate regulon response regulator CusR